jgi:hypothetical protein
MLKAINDRIFYHKAGWQGDRECPVKILPRKNHSFSPGGFKPAKAQEIHLRRYSLGVFG